MRRQQQGWPAAQRRSMRTLRHAPYLPLPALRCTRVRHGAAQEAPVGPVQEVVSGVGAVDGLWAAGRTGCPGRRRVQPDQAALMHAVVTARAAVAACCGSAQDWQGGAPRVPVALFGMMPASSRARRGVDVRAAPYVEVAQQDDVAPGVHQAAHPPKQCLPRGGGGGGGRGSSWSQRGVWRLAHASCCGPDGAGAGPAEDSALLSGGGGGIPARRPS
jgi:hypothetical protein